MFLKRIIDGVLQQGDINILLWDNYTLTFLISFIVGVVVLSIIVGAFFGLLYLIIEKFVPWNRERIRARRDREYEERNLIKYRQEPLENKPSQAAVLYDSLKERFCKKIEWEAGDR